MSDLELELEPRTTPDVEEGEHDRFAHLVLEGFRDGDAFLPAGPSVAEGIVEATPVRALCGKIWVPGRDPRRYPLYETCRELAASMGWRIPTT